MSRSLPVPSPCRARPSRPRNQGKARTLQEMAQHATVTVIGAFTIVLPVPMFASMPGYARLTTGWRRMEAMYVALTGGPLVLGIKWLDYISGLLLIHAAVLSVTLAYQLGARWPLPAGVCQPAPSEACGGNGVQLGLFLTGCWRLAVAGRGLLAKATVVQMLQAFCESNSAVQLPHLLSMFVLCVAYFFSFVYTFLGNFQDLLSVDKPELLQGLWSSMVANTLLYITTGGAIFLICISAQVAINQIFLRARKSLLRMCISGQSEAMRTEIVYFLEDIDSRKPVVSLSGFLYVDRTTIVSVSGVLLRPRQPPPLPPHCEPSNLLQAVVICTTYIVVLSQFTIQFA
ncbi:uncharacterized protein LOC117641176 [Thrips palmi]|uniref:Uncharacterized protein LOC117641176 n=1 Tax=Thrips palmi TaxID=161013 RepID=A0A6P8YJU4_THRPL|nr:uncharacterized protein LOC117641176 [Thrips palmi]